MVYKFVDHNNAEKPTDSIAYKLHKKLKTKGYNNFSKKEKENLHGLFDELCYYETFTNAIKKLHGYIIDFSEFTNTYWVRFKYYGIRKIEAFNKTMIRKNACNPSYIKKIVQVD